MNLSIDRNDEKLAQSALDALLASTGVHGRLAPMRGVATGSAYQPDLAIEITIEKKRLTYYGERKSVADRATVLAQVKGRLDVNFIDATGGHHECRGICRRATFCSVGNDC